MWLLSCEGDLFDGKRLWLRPGSTHLLGRTSGKSANGERVQYIDHKSVSRKHLVLTVGEIKPGDSTQLHVRSEVQAIDGSKTGTTIDGEKFNNGTRVLAEDVHTIKLGSYASTFRLQWQAVVLSITTLPKGAKARNDALALQRQRLEHAGIKIATEYVTNETTHLIVKKRNTAAGLQALVQGRWLLTDSFVDALANACERKEDSVNGEQSISLLEQEFDVNWPREDDHIVPAGGEPVVRPDEDLKPRSDRADVFDSLTFVFLSQNQHDQLMPVVTGGGGKATVFPFELDESSTQDVVDFVKESAGQKRNRSGNTGNISGQNNIVVVRPISKEEGRVQDIMRDIEIALNQRSIEQNEFLDAILTNDTSCLIRQLRDASPANDLEEGMEAGSAAPVDDTTVIESPSKEDRAPAPIKPKQEGTQQETSAVSRRRNRQAVTASRFKGFDDFDPSQIVQPEPDSPEPSLPDRETSEVPHVQSNSNNARQLPSRKRPAMEDPVEAERRMLDNIAPSTVGPKRQRLQQQNDKPPVEVSAIKREIAEASKRTANVLNMDIKSAIKERREQEEERRRQDEEYLKNALDMEIGEIKKLVKVEEFQIPVRSAASRESRANVDTHDHERRWDSAWNGRQNFKKFRKLRPSAEQENATPLRRPKRLVALEEVPKRGLSLDEDYFLQSSVDKSLGRSQSQAQVSQNRSFVPATQPDRTTGASANNEQGGSDPHTDHLAFRRRIARSREEDAEVEELNSLVPDDPRSATAAASTRKKTQTQLQSHTLVAETQPSGRKAVGGKRPAAEPLGGGSTAKKARSTKADSDAADVTDSAARGSARPRRAAATTAAASTARRAATRPIVIADDDDDDVLKFRRKKR